MINILQTHTDFYTKFLVLMKTKIVLFEDRLIVSVLSGEWFKSENGHCLLKLPPTKPIFPSLRLFIEYYMDTSQSIGIIFTRQTRTETTFPTQSFKFSRCFNDFGTR